MAKMTKLGYVPEPKDVHNGSYTPDPEVSGKRFEPDGNGGGTLFIRSMVIKPGFRKPIEAFVKIIKAPMLPTAT
jgi:hypothetical protein